MKKKLPASLMGLKRVPEEEEVKCNASTKGH